MAGQQQCTLHLFFALPIRVNSALISPWHLNCPTPYAQSVFFLSVCFWTRCEWTPFRYVGLNSPQFCSVLTFKMASSSKTETFCVACFFLFFFKISYWKQAMKQPHRIVAHSCKLIWWSRMYVSAWKEVNVCVDKERPSSYCLVLNRKRKKKEKGGLWTESRERIPPSGSACLMYVRLEPSWFW